MEEIKNEGFFILVAPDGTPQPATLGADFQTCLGYLKLLHSKGIGESPSKLLFKGFKILPVKLSILQNGDEDTAFKKS